MSKKLDKNKIIAIYREKKGDIFIRGEDQLVYQDNKIIKLKDSETRYDKNYKYIKPKSVNHKFWDGFHGWRYLFICFINII